MTSSRTYRAEGRAGGAPLLCARLQRRRPRLCAAGGCARRRGADRRAAAGPRRCRSCWCPRCGWRWRLAADAFYGHPSRELQMVGITGTNGKTTTAFLAARACWRRPGSGRAARHGRAARRRRRGARRAHDPRERRPAGHASPHAGCRRPVVRDGGLLPRPRARARRRRATSLPPCSPTSPRTTSTSTRHGGLLPRQGAAVRVRARRRSTSAIRTACGSPARPAAP